MEVSLFNIHIPWFKKIDLKFPYLIFTLIATGCYSIQFPLITLQLCRLLILFECLYFLIFSIQSAIISSKDGDGWSLGISILLGILMIILLIFMPLFLQKFPKTICGIWSLINLIIVHNSTQSDWTFNIYHRVQFWFLKSLDGFFIKILSSIYSLKHGLPRAISAIYLIQASQILNSDNKRHKTYWLKKWCGVEYSYALLFLNPHFLLTICLAGVP